MLGFKARRSWRLVEVKACPVADPRIVAAIPALTQVAAAFFEHPKSAPTLHVTWTLSGLDVAVTGVERRSGGGLSADAQMQAIQAAHRADLARRHYRLCDRCVAGGGWHDRLHHVVYDGKTPLQAP